MVGESEIDQRDPAARPENDVVRLEIEMDRVLQVQVVNRVGNQSADASHLQGREHAPFQHALEAFAIDPFGDQIRRLREVACGDEPRHVGAGQGRQDHRLGLEADEILARLAGPDARHLHDRWKAAFGRDYAEDLALGAGMDARAEAEAVDFQVWRSLL